MKVIGRVEQHRPVGRLPVRRRYDWYNVVRLCFAIVAAVLATALYMTGRPTPVPYLLIASATLANLGKPGKPTATLVAIACAGYAATLL